MPPRVALIIGYAFAFWLLMQDRKWRKLNTPALWIPAIWLTILGSRPLSFWIGGGGGGSSTEGSPINVVCNGFLIVSAFVILMRRGFNWAEFANRNKALIAIYLYYAISAAWSNFPLSSAKRIFNDFGCVLIALLFVTDKTPADSIRLVYTRIACFLFPLSVVFIRYFPGIGRISSRSGDQMLTGVTGHKNSLGQLVVVLGLVMLWDLVQSRKSGPAPEKAMEKYSRLFVFGLGIYLLFLCKSATALVCVTVGALLFAAGGRIAKVQNIPRLLVLTAIAGGGIWILESQFGLSDAIFDLLGREKNLTGRTDIWDEVKKVDINSLIGSGFRGFWETRQGVDIYEELNINRLFTAHNGYLETFLNGGYIAVVLLGILLLSGGAIALKKLFRGDLMGKLALAFWVISVIYNNSESNFFILEPLWFTWLLFMVDYPNAQTEAVPVASLEEGENADEQSISADGSSLQAPELTRTRHYGPCPITQ